MSRRAGVVLRGWRLARLLVWLVPLALPALVLAAPVSRVQAQPKPVRRPVEARLVAGVPRVTFDATDFADRPLRDKLKSGLPQTIMVRVITRDERTGAILGASAQSCRVLYDLWQGHYRVQYDRPRRTADLTMASVGDVVAKCLRLRELAVPATRDVRLAGKRVYYAIAIELNPMSQATVRRIQRWLRRPAAGQLRGDAFFGSFVSIFVSKKMGTADRSILYRSQVWVVPR